MIQTKMMIMLSHRTILNFPISSIFLYSDITTRIMTAPEIDFCNERTKRHKKTQVFGKADGG